MHHHLWLGAAVASVAGLLAVQAGAQATAPTSTPPSTKAEAPAMSRPDLIGPDDKPVSASAKPHPKARRSGPKSVHRLDEPLSPGR